MPHGMALSCELRMSPHEPADAGARAGVLLLRAAASRGLLAASENAESLMCCWWWTEVMMRRVGRWYDVTTAQRVPGYHCRGLVVCQA